MTKIRKAVFPVAGLGTRFLPETKTSPKEMLPVVDKPLIQDAVAEAAAAGITDMIFVTGHGKRSIEDHFDKAYELEAELEEHGKTRQLQDIRDSLPANLNYTTIRQNEALGLGHAVLCARPLVGDEPFAVILADDLIDADMPVLGQMMDLFEQYGSSVIGVQNLPREQMSHYGVIDPQPMSARLHRVAGIVEKPASELAPSTLGVFGRYPSRPLSSAASSRCSLEAAARSSLAMASPCCCATMLCWPMNLQATAMTADRSPAIWKPR